MVVGNVLGGEQAGYDNIKSLLYKPPSQGMQEFFKSNVESLYNNTSNYSKEFINSTQELYDRYTSSDAVNRAKRMLFRTRTTLDKSTIYPIDANNIQSANPVMRRWIMSAPAVRHLHEKQLCNGFDDSIDPYSTLEINRATSGVLQEDEDDGLYLRFAFDDEESYDMVDKLSIAKTWDTVKMLLDNGIDPTSEELDEM